MTAAARLAKRFKAKALEPRQLGEEAFKKGLKSVPAHDPALMKWIRENGVTGKETVKALREWTQGWTRANLAAPVE